MMCGIAHASSQVEISEPQDAAGVMNIISAALKGQEGIEYRTTLTGAVAEKIAADTGSPGPYSAAITKVGSYKREGCGRVKIAYLFPNAKTKDGGRADANINYEQDLCADGSMPDEWMEKYGRRMANDIKAKQNKQP